MLEQFSTDLPSNESADERRRTRRAAQKARCGNESDASIDGPAAEPTPASGFASQPEQPSEWTPHQEKVGTSQSSAEDEPKSGDGANESDSKGAKAHGPLTDLTDDEAAAMHLWGKAQIDRAVANLQSAMKAHEHKSLIGALAKKLAPLVDAQLIDADKVKSELAEALKTLAGGWTEELDEAFAIGLASEVKENHPALRELKKIRAQAQGASEADEGDDMGAHGHAVTSAEEILRVVEQLNEDYFLIHTGGKTRVGTYLQTEIGEVVSLMLDRDFVLLHANKYVHVERADGKVVAKNIGSVWIGHPKRRDYKKGFAFDAKGPRDLPDGQPGQQMNLWRGFATEPKKGSWPRVKNHILNVLANGNTDYANYIYKWLAWKFQNPGGRPEVALVFRSLEGSGKSIFFEGVVAMIFGSHARVLSDPRHVTGNFNAHMRGACFVLGEEAFFAGDRAKRGVLYNNITARSLMIELKGIDPVAEANRAGHVFLTNHKWAVPAGENARRFAVFDTSDKYAKDRLPDAERKAYFDALSAEIENACAAAMLHEMLHFDLQGWHPRDAVPQTAALQEQKELSLEPLDRWWLHVLKRGCLPDAREVGDIPTDWHTARPLAFLTQWAATDAQGLLRNAYNELSEDSIGRYLATTLGLKRLKDPKGKRGYWAPATLKEARAAWETRFGGWSWDDPEADWTNPYAAPAEEQEKKNPPFTVVWPPKTA